MGLADVFNAPPNPKYSGKGGGKRKPKSAFDSPLINLSMAWAKLCGKIVIWFGSKFIGIFHRKKKYSSNEMRFHRWD